MDTGSVAVCPGRGRIVMLLAVWAGLAGSAFGQFSATLGGSGVDIGVAVATDSQGNIYVAGSTTSPDFPATPGAVQTKLGGGSDAFVAKYAPGGTLQWATFFGGSGNDAATAIAVDPPGNVVVAGNTLSSDLAMVHALQSTKAAGSDAFLLKLNAGGSQILYSTFLGGSDNDFATGVAADLAGNIYVAGNAGTSYSAVMPGIPDPNHTGGIFVIKTDPNGALLWGFLRAGVGSAGGLAVDSGGSAYVTGTASSHGPTRSAQALTVSGTSQALVFKLSPDGLHQVYETAIGGSVWNSGRAIAVDRKGSAYVAGTTWSADFPKVGALQSSLQARPLWKSSDHGATWTPLDNLPFAFPQTLVVNPTAPATLYVAAIDGGVFKSTDGGANWSNHSSGISGSRVTALVMDPTSPQTLYAGTDDPNTSKGAIYKSSDGAQTWTLVDAGAGMVSQLTADASGTIYEVAQSGYALKTTDGGVTWRGLAVTGPGTQMLTPDPQAAGSVYAYSTFLILGPFADQLPAFYRSMDGGANWQMVSTLTVKATDPGVILDASSTPSTIYAGLGARSNDGGVTWVALTTPTAPTGGNPNVGGTAMAADPSSGALYAATQYPIGLFVSGDHGQTWMPSGSPVVPSPDSGWGPVINSLVFGAAPDTLYAIVENLQSSAFVTKLSADGTTILYSTLLNGHPSMDPSQNRVYGLTIQSLVSTYANSIALDSSGNILVAGTTRSNDFPLVKASQSGNAGRSDAFAARITADGSQLSLSTYLGGSREEEGLGVADARGNLAVVGQTYSPDFPAKGVPLSDKGNAPRAFVTGFSTCSAGGRSIDCGLGRAAECPLLEVFGLQSRTWCLHEGAAALRRDFSGQ